jgi:D-alanyl-D-alanine carboxypeptidase
VHSSVDTLSNTVDTLHKLVSTDPQLLQKYSKVFFLNENYTPSALTTIDTKYIFNKDKPLQFLDPAYPFLRKLLDNAIADNIPLEVDSAYRSFGMQESLKSTYKVVYGAGTANSFSADQGYSEHQLGTAVDFTTPDVGAGLTGFDKTTAYTWLQNNAYRYGFELSYPAHNSYYIFEPWHWRFVGLDLAFLLHNQNKNFYDLDQRQINTYLINFFNGVVTSPISN